MKTSLLTLGLVSLASAAFAQTQNPAPEAPSQDCAPVSHAENSPDPSKPLSDKLADSKGVICPPPTPDSNIRVKPPETDGRMPVIPPPPSAK